jgi:hypothetical protein
MTLATGHINKDGIYAKGVGPRTALKALLLPKGSSASAPSTPSRANSPFGDGGGGGGSPSKLLSVANDGGALHVESS